MDRPDTKFRLRLLFQETAINEGVYTLGRSRDCSITVDDPTVSRVHARLTVDPDVAFIEDLESHNGTTVNGAPLNMRRKLANGDVIKIGDYEFSFLADNTDDLKGQRPTIQTHSCPDCGLVIPLTLRTCPNCERDPNAATSPTLSVGPAIPTSLDEPEEESPAAMREAISLAFSMNHLDKAALILDARIAQFERGGINEASDPSVLRELSELSVKLGKGLLDESRISWVFDTWMQTGAEIPEEILIDMERAALGWMSLAGEARRYMSHINNLPPMRRPSSVFVERLKSMM